MNLKKESTKSNDQDPSRAQKVRKIALGAGRLAATVALGVGIYNLSSNSFGGQAVKGVAEHVQSQIAYDLASPEEKKVQQAHADAAEASLQFSIHKDQVKDGHVNPADNNLPQLPSAEEAHSFEVATK